MSQLINFTPAPENKAGDLQTVGNVGAEAPPPFGASSCEPWWDA